MWWCRPCMRVVSGAPIRLLPYRTRRLNVGPSSAERTIFSNYGPRQAEPGGVQPKPDAVAWDRYAGVLARFVVGFDRCVQALMSIVSPPKRGKDDETVFYFEKEVRPTWPMKLGLRKTVALWKKGLPSQVAYARRVPE